MSLLIKNARVVDYSGERFKDVAMCNGLISAVEESIEPAGFYEVIDAHGLVLMPAACDLHCHLRDPGYPQKETMETGMRAALAGGYSTLTAMANTAPVIETPEQVMANHHRAKSLGLCRLVQAAAAGVGLEDAVPTDRKALSSVTCVLSNDGKTIFNDDFMENLLIDSTKYGFVVSTHCQPERKMIKRDLALLEKVGGNLHVGHISHRETVDMLRDAKARGLRVTCEVTPHHLFGYDMDYKVNPPIRSKVDTEALIAGIAEGTVDCLSTDHAPHTVDDKHKGMAGISCIEHALAIYYKVFSDNGLPLSLMSKLCSYNTNKRLGLNGGSIECGKLADVVLFDPKCIWMIDDKKMLSRSHNTPFIGREVLGRVYMTVVGGKILYDYGQTQQSGSI